MTTELLDNYTQKSNQNPNLEFLHQNSNRIPIRIPVRIPIRISISKFQLEFQSEFQSEFQYRNFNVIIPIFNIISPIWTRIPVGKVADFAYDFVFQ